MTVTKYESGQSTLPTPNPTKSFWHSEPSKFLLGHRTTPELPNDADVVIVGSGLTGASAARHIQQEYASEALNAVMLEAREVCWGATGRNGGHCQPLLYSSSTEVGAFELRNYESIKSLITKENIPCEWRSLKGCHTYLSTRMFNHALSNVKTVKSQAPKLGDMIQVITKESSNPSLEDLRIPNAAGALIQEKAASLWPYKVVAWILERLIKDGSLNLQTKTPVTHLQKVDERWIVHTARGMIAAKQVLLCTNAYTSALLPEFSDLIVPVRGEMSALIPPASMKMKKSVEEGRLDYSYVFVGHGTQNLEQDDYLVQRLYSTPAKEKTEGGELMFGGGRSYAAHAGVGVSDDSSIDEPAAAYLRRELNVVLNLNSKEQELKARYEWSGVMGYSRDGHPWVGEVDEALGGGKGLWVSSGYTGHGMPNTWLCGKAVVDLMFGKTKEVDLPAGFRITQQRVKKARELDEVKDADLKAFR